MTLLLLKAKKIEKLWYKILVRFFQASNINLIAVSDIYITMINNAKTKYSLTPCIWNRFKVYLTWINFHMDSTSWKRTLKYSVHWFSQRQDFFAWKGCLLFRQRMIIKNMNFFADMGRTFLQVKPHLLSHFYLSAIR